MKTLVVYYSRTGITEKVAKTISKSLNGDIEKIIDLKNRKGVIGYLIGGGDAATKRLTEIKEAEKDPSLYDIVLIGTPVWVFTMAPAIRTYLTKNKDRFKKVAFFCTEGGAGSKRMFKEMENVCGKKPAAIFETTTFEVVKNAYMPHVEKFIETIRAISK